MIKFQSKVGKATPNRDSLRIILPQQLRKILDINAGDTVEWIVNITEDNVEVNLEKIEKE